MVKRTDINHCDTDIIDRPNQVDLIDLLVRAWARPEVPIAIIGDPGSGKTSQVEAFCESYGLPLVKVLASTMDETDVSGILVYDQIKDMATLKRNELFSRLMDHGGVLFLDEFNTARQEVADTLLTLIQSRELPGGYKLPLNTLIVAAMNDAKQCDNYELSPAMKNRFMWIHQKGNLAQWWDFMTGKNQRLGKKKKPLEKPIGQREFIKWFQQPQNAADKKRVISWAIENELEVSDDNAITSMSAYTSRRSLTNLLYWTNDAEDLLFWAPAFIEKSAAVFLNAIPAKAWKTTANAIFSNGFDQIDSGDENESLRLSSSLGSLQKIIQRAK